MRSIATLLTLDTPLGSLVQQPETLYGDPPCSSPDPVDPQLRAGRTLFARTVETAPCDHRATDVVRRLPPDDRVEQQAFRGLLPPHRRTRKRPRPGLVDHFSTAPTPTDPTFNPHDVLVALIDRGSRVDPTGASRADQRSRPPDARGSADGAANRARHRGKTHRGPTWLLEKGAPNLAWDAQFCGGAATTNRYAA
jgi:hypothetical protein